MLKTFDDLVGECLKAEIPYRLLYVYVKMPASRQVITQESATDTKPSGMSGSGCSISFDAHEMVRADLCFSKMMENADAYSTDWDIVFVGLLKTEDGSSPSAHQIAETLTLMRKSIVTGKFRGPIFDRTGHHMSLVRHQSRSPKPTQQKFH